MFSALRSDERAVLLAHEAAHLSGHHHLYVQLAQLAGAANPLLAPTARAVRLAVERDADEAAVAEVGDRRLVARAIARAGLAIAAARRSRSTMASVAAALSAADSLIMQRTKALLAPAPQPRRALAAGFMLLTVLTVTATALTAQQTDDRLDRAELSAPTLPRQPAAVAESKSTVR
jgi:beta-lactamase regulating signal transducer with metallopeptidase domain